MIEKNKLAIQKVKVRLSALEESEMEQWLHDLTGKIESLTEEQRSQLKEVLKKELVGDGKQVQILGGNQNIGHQQFIFQEETVSKLSNTLSALAVTIKEQYGVEVGGEIIKTAIMAFAGVLGK